MNPGDGADQRRLARAVRSDNSDDRAFLDLQRYAVERLRVAVKHVEVFDAEHQCLPSSFRDAAKRRAPDPSPAASPRLILRSGRRALLEGWGGLMVRDALLRSAPHHEAD